MVTIFRVLSILIAAGFTLTAANWIFDPSAAAENLGMTLLTGMGASTQIGDIGAFFLAVAAMIGIAQGSGRAHWLYPAAILLGFAALMRTLAWLAGHAPFGSEFILPEIVMAGILVMAARSRDAEGQAQS